MARQKEPLSISQYEGSKQQSRYRDLRGAVNHCSFFMPKNYKEILTDANNLYRAAQISRKASGWKSSTQRFMFDYLSQIAKMQKELMEQSYKPSKGTAFVISERGKTRHIRSNPMYDKVVRRCLCDEVLVPELSKYLIYDNGASVPGKGLSFARKRLEHHLHDYYRKTGTNVGYILLVDYSKYYDNIRHDRLMEQVEKHIQDKYVLWLLQQIISNFEVDVSYMSDEEYEHCLEQKYNPDAVDPTLQTGVRYMAKSLGIGDQVSQILSIYFPHTIDNYIKIVRGMKWYERYMDDSCLISQSKEELHEIYLETAKQAQELGIHINKKKTHIMRIDKGFSFLQMRYRLTETGHLVKRINPKRVTDARRRLKKLAKLELAGKVEPGTMDASYRTWIGSTGKLASQRTKLNMKRLYLILCKELRK